MFGVRAEEAQRPTLTETEAAGPAAQGPDSVSGASAHHGPGPLPDRSAVRGQELVTEPHALAHAVTASCEESEAHL